MATKEQSYGSVTVSQSDYELIKALSIQLSREFSKRNNAQIKVSMSQVINLAVNFYNQRRGFEVEK
jgi:hypothetical protein